MNRPFWSFRTSAPLDNCETLEPLLSLAADGLTSPEETLRLDAHLPSCENCRTALSWMQATRTALASRPAAIPPPDLHSRITLAIALSSRLVAVPPPGLQAQIARAIAASSAAPVSLRTARVFTLRTAYAAAASLTALGIALIYPLWHTTGEVAATKPTVNPPVLAAALPVKTTVVPKTTRPLVASSAVKPVAVKHTSSAHKTAPIIVTPPESIASNEVPTKLSAAPQAIEAPVHHAPLSPQIASLNFGPIQKHSIGKHAPLPIQETVAPKPLEGPQVAKVIKAPLRLDLPAPKITPDAAVVRTAASTHELAHPSSDNPLGPVIAHLVHSSHASLAEIPVSVNHHFQEAASLAQTASSGDHVVVLGDIHSP